MNSTDHSIVYGDDLAVVIATYLWQLCTLGIYYYENWNY